MESPGEIQIAMVNGSDPDPVRCAARVTSGGKLHIVALASGRYLAPKKNRSA
jgi:hypothetical protein